MKILLNAISLLASITVAIMALYLLQYYTIGMIPKFRNLTIGRIYLKDIVFFVIAIVVVVLFFRFHLPY
jgi:hypothetical protein